MASLTPILAAPVWNIFTAGFGVAAAVLLVGGIVLLRFQRNRYDFAIAKAALEKGIAPSSGSQPAWLISLRQGIMALALGVGLLGVGLAAWLMPPAATLPAATRPFLQAVESVERADEKRAKPEPRPFDAAREQWERARRQETIGKTLAGCGAILVLLGIVRIGFARVERQYTAGEIS